MSLEQEVAQHKEDAGKAQSEVERLLEILKETENEKNDKEKKIHELERWETRMERWCGLIEKYKSELIILSSLRLNYLLLTNPSFRTNPLVLYLFPLFSFHFGFTLFTFVCEPIHMYPCDNLPAWVCACVFTRVCNHQTPETPLPLICGVLNSPENRPLPLLALSSQWEGWCGTTWAREWLVALSVI